MQSRCICRRRTSVGVTDRGQTYVEVRDVVVQQGLDVVNALLGANKGERDHSLCQQITKTQQRLL